MNREILFRGKSLRSGNWVEGSLLIFPKTKRAKILVYEEADLDFNNVEVDPATVGQYTGLKDKNGKRIFEGDVYQYFDDEIQVVEWSEAFTRIMLHTLGEHELKRGRKIIKEKFDGWSDLDDYPLSAMEYLGNIHDNPELLKGGEG